MRSDPHDELIRLVDPHGADGEVGGVDPAPRPVTTGGTRLALLDNGKPNAAHVLERLAATCTGPAAPAEVLAVGKAVASTAADEDILLRFRGFDAAIVGVGD